MYQGTFAKKNRVRGLPAPLPGGPPALGSLVWSAEGLPSTRNWPFRWPLSPTSPPQVIRDTQGNVSRQLAGAVVLGGGAAPAPPLVGSGRSCSCAPSIRVPKKIARCPGLRALYPEAWPGSWLSYARWSRGGAGGTKPLLLYASFLVSPTTAAYKRRNARGRRKCAVPGTSWRSCFEPSPLDYLGPTRRKRGRDQLRGL
jgi:hypothetical protein